MLSPTEEHRLRDLMTIQLLEATSHPDALGRARAEEHRGMAAYDSVLPGASPRLTQRVQPRDVVDACVLCGRAFVSGERPTRFCSRRCANYVDQYRRRHGLVA